METRQTKARLAAQRDMAFNIPRTPPKLPSHSNEGEESDPKSDPSKVSDRPEGELYEHLSKLKEAHDRVKGMEKLNFEAFKEEYSRQIADIWTDLEGRSANSKKERRLIETLKEKVELLEEK